MQDPKSELPKVTDLPIERTFAYLDISDFSTYPAGHEAAIMKTLVGIVNDDSLWRRGGGLNREPETMLCIGDGYIYAFKDPLAATYFTAYLAH